MIQNLLSSFKGSDKSDSQEIKEWRARVLNGILRAIFVLWLFALAGGINNVLQAYREEAYLYENPLLMAVSVLSIYLAVTAILAFITFYEKIKFEARAILLLFIFYTLGTIGMSLSSFSGDGRVFFFAFIVLAAVFFDLRYSLTAFLFTLFTLVVLGWLQVSQTLVVPAERQVNATDWGAWVSGGIIFLVLSSAVLISITYLLQALKQSLAESHELLAREQRVSRLLRTLSDINQLIVREQDATRMLQRACEILVTECGYSFSWISLLEADKLTLKLTASFGATLDPALFTVHLNQAEDDRPRCAVVALRTKKPFLTVHDENDPCASCPLLKQYPHRCSMILPIVREERTFGVLTLVHSIPTDAFDQEEMDLLLELADDLAFALEKLETDRRLQSHIRRETLINEITQAALETPDLESMLQTLANRLCELIEAQSCYIVLLDSDGKNFIPSAATGPLREIFLSVRLTDDETRMAKTILQVGQTLIVEDVNKDPRISPRISEMFSIDSLLGLPLTADGRNLGTVFLTFQEPRSFGADEVLIVEQIAGHVALALSKTILYKETHAKAMELGKLYLAAQDMASSLSDPDALLVTLIRHMTEALETTSGYIYTVDLSAEKIFILAEYWADTAGKNEIQSDMGKSYSLRDYPTFNRAVTTGQVISLQFDDEDVSEMERWQFSAYDVRTIMFIPVLAHGKLVGGVEIWESRYRREFTHAEINLVHAMAGHAGSIMESARLYETERRHVAALTTLRQVSLDLVSHIDLPALLNTILERAMELFNAPIGCLYLMESNERSLQIVTGRGGLQDYVGTSLKLGEGISGIVAQTGEPLLVHDYQAWAGKSEAFKDFIVGTVMGVPVKWQGRVLGVINVDDVVPNRFMDSDIELIGLFADQAAVAIANARLFETIEQRESHFRALIENSAEGVAILDANGIIRYMAPSEERLTGYTVQEVMGQSIFDNIHPEDIPNLLQAFQRGVHVPGVIIQQEYRHKRKNGEWRNYEVTGHNLLHDPNVAGVVVNYRDITERKRAEQDLLRHAHELEALAAASAALRTAQSVTEIIPVLANQALRAVGGDYSSIFLLDPVSSDYVSHGWFSARGESKNKLKDESILRHRPGEGITGHVALTGEIYVTEDIQNDPVTHVLGEEEKRLKDLHGGISLPLRAQDEIIGVMHIWMFGRHIFNESEIRILIAFAETAGNAIHRAMLFEQTVQQADELVHAYDNTLAGWARALELRDELTEGHTRRVTELTVQLARAMGVPENALVQIRRGALLHDIGKMGIPDSILHKPGPLTANEQKIMRMHTQYAYDMLLLIPFLRQALDIPYCHHEKWDGTGYPRGLKGEQIPLAARIFAVVDVWDALTSDRPYRNAWSSERVRDYLLSESGKYFDPRITEKFLQLDLSEFTN
ncbi:MAG: GAF domain-containing protein [Chloroflexi bacterium]|nr:GAF domain-containing protein [Chloroflexota bacterium]